MSEPPIGMKVRQKEKGSVWVVEDEEDVRHLLGEQLEAQGYETTLLRDGYEFLEIVQTGSSPCPDSIICDWHLEPLDKSLPRIDAPAVLRMAEHHFPKTPVIVITGWHKNLQDLHKVMLYGARAFLTKPYVFHELLEKLSAVTTVKGKSGGEIGAAGKGSEAKGAHPGGKSKGIQEVQRTKAARASVVGEEAPVSPASKKETPPARAASPAQKASAGTANGLPPPAASASAIEPGHLAPAEELLEEDVVRDYALSFEDLITDFEEDLLTLEHHFESGRLENFAEAFEVAQKGYRSLHTLKGNAGFMKANHSQKLIHRLEDVLGDVRSHLESLDGALVQRLIDHFLTGKDVLTGICSFMQTHRRESGYETTPAYRLYEHLLAEIDSLGEEIKKAGAGAEKEDGDFDDMF